MLLQIGTEAAQAKANAEAVKRFGMHYQWGRKDPFTPSSATAYAEVQIYKANGTAITKGAYGIATPSKQSEFKYEARTTTNQTTINNLIQNPSTHYAKGDGANWVPIASAEYYNTTNKGDWWNPTIKTIYDPCPNGYRIPKEGTYGNTNSEKPAEIGWDWSGSGLASGMIWTKSFFPASGLRFLDSGVFTLVGTHGYGWMSTPNSATQGHILVFSSSTVSHNLTGSRSYGRPARCIKEQ